LINAISEETIRGCAQKDAGCQKIIYEYYYKKMYAICLRYTNDRDEAKDLLHDGFMKFFDKIGSFNDHSRLDAWTRRLFTNHCIDYVRSAYKKHMVSLEDRHYDYTSNTSNDEDDNTSEFDIHAYSPEELIHAISMLRVDYRLVLNMYAIEKYSHQEIAEQLGIEYATSRSKLLRARQSLKKILMENKQSGE
jgi:RNA polymerase sigma factor (sigma-70 family)